VKIISSFSAKHMFNCLNYPCLTQKDICRLGHLVVKNDKFLCLTTWYVSSSMHLTFPGKMGEGFSEDDIYSR
jgi:hypothetical protein